MALETIAIDSQGAAHTVGISMSPSWDIQAYSNGQAIANLSLSCVFPWGQDVIYLFSSLSRDETPLELLPSPVSEVLLFPPVIPLKWQQGGFQALYSAEWEALVITELADRPPTCASAPLKVLGSPPTWEEDENGITSDDENISENSADEEESVQNICQDQQEDDDDDEIVSYCSGCSE